MLYILVDALRTTLMDWGVYRVLMPLDQLEFRALAAAVLAMAVVVVAGKPVIRWLRRMKIGDAGLTDAEALQTQAASKRNVPTMGGVLISGSIAVSVLLLADLRNDYVQLALVTLLWLAAVGGADDWLKLTASRRPGGSRQGLYAWEKLVFQLGIGLIVGWFAFQEGDAEGVARDMAHAVNLPFEKSYDPEGGFGPASGLWYLSPIAFVIVMTLFITGMSNAVNISDGMDGLATGVMACVSVGLLVLTFIAGDQTTAQELLVPFVATSDELMVVVGALAGACLGFLWWNCAPAQVFMGDTGSLSLGGLAAYVAVVIRQEFVLLVMCGIFLLEIGSVVAQVGYFKYTGGRRLIKCAPYHHHLHLSGWTEPQIVVRFWIVSVLLVALGLLSLKLR